MKAGIIGQRLALLFSLLVVAASPTFAQSQCAGPIPDSHNYGTYNFETNSRLEPNNFGNFKFGIVSCIRNTKDDVFELYVNWLIPGPRGFVPPHETLLSLPRLVIDDKVAPLKGCLQYANRGDFTYAHFLGSKDDQRFVDDETSRGCRASAAIPIKAPDGLPQKIFFKFRNFFPADTKDPRFTMLQIDGSVSLAALGDNAYTSVVDYQISPYKGSKGSADGVSIRPAFVGPAPPLLKSFLEKNEEQIALKDEGSINFIARDVRNPTLIYAAYEVVDRQKRVVAAISFPAYVSQPESR